jgi:RNA polymerase sigma-70 factor (ECF subfamily)
VAYQPNGLAASDDFLEAARQGDVGAWETIVRDYRPYLFAVVRRSLENRPPGDCSSVVQDGLVTAFERIEQFRGRTRAELLGWLSRIVTNKASDRKRGHTPSPLPVRSDGEEILQASGSTPSAQVAQRERAARVLEAMEKLTPDYRDVIYMRIFQNLGYEEIAANLGRTNDAVRCLWVRALRRLGAELGEEP